jgi:AcrR family transcriptional regulator
LTTSRKEAKAETRQRLLDAALTVLDDEGDSALTTMRVTKLAGIAQSSFYVHFADVDDLLRQLVDDLLAALRVDVADDDLRALLDEAAYGRQPDPGAASGDDGDPSLDASCHCVFLSWFPGLDRLDRAVLVRLR